MDNFIIIAVIVLILALAIGYIVKAKKSGAKCVGCPSAKECSSKNNTGGCGCGCGGNAENK